MRFEITLFASDRLSLPIDMREYLTAAIYAFIERADPGYARFLHDEGFATADGSGRRYKLFTYSRLDVPLSRRRIDKSIDRIIYAPGEIKWWISSPVEEFIRNVVGGLLAIGHLQIATARLPVVEIKVLPTPTFTEEMHFTCRSPIIAARPIPKSEGGGTHFLRPLDDPRAFSEIIRQGLIAKYKILCGKEPVDTRFEMVFDQEYLERHRGGTKLTHFKDTKMVGALAPFVGRGSGELMETGWHAGLGSKTGLGHGMVEALG